MQVAPLELWTLGLTEKEKNLVVSCAGEEYSLCSLDSMDAEEIAASIRLAEKNEPLLLWLGSAAWFNLCTQNQELSSALSVFPRVLVLEENCEVEHVYHAFDDHYQQVVCGPLAENHVFDALSRAREASNMFMDMARMTREVMLGREMLERKSAVFSMLFSFFSSVEKSKNIAEWLYLCRQALGQSLGLENVHLAWWGKHLELGRAGSQSAKEVFFLGLPEHSPVQGAWHQYLKDRACTLMPGLENSACVCLGHPAATDGIMPEAAHVLLVPLGPQTGTVAYGFLALHLSQAFKPARDVAQSLEMVASYAFYYLLEQSRKSGGEFFTARSLHTGEQEKAMGQ